MDFDTIIATVKQAFAPGATPADKAKGAQVMRLGLQALEAQPGQPLATPPAMAPETTQPTTQIAEVIGVLDKLVNHFYQQLPADVQQRIDDDAASDIPMMINPL